VGTVDGSIDTTREGVSVVMSKRVPEAPLLTAATAADDGRRFDEI
jgi:hypothetical protein